MKQVCAGIDLGTSYSCIGIYMDDKVHIVDNEYGTKTTPSCVYYDNDGHICVGHAASNKKQNVMRNVKRLIGIKYTDDIKRLLKRSYNYEIICGIDEEIILCPNDTIQTSPVEVSTKIIDKLLNSVKDKYNVTVSDVVITVPAYFNDKQRTLTKIAAENAGVNVIRIINEPTAASIAYGINDLQEKTVLVFDLGGGTLDVSLLNIENNVFMVQCTFGDTKLGGVDFNNKLMEYCYKEYCRINKITGENIINLLNDELSKTKLYNAVEKAKIELSKKDFTDIYIDNFHQDRDLILNITRTKFEILCKDEFDRCISAIQQVITDSGIKLSDLNDIIMIGGSSRIPKLIDMIYNYTNILPKTDIDPDTTVAYGATLHCASISKNVIYSTDITLIDVVSLSLGIETKDGIMIKIIEKNTVIPCRCEKIFTVCNDNQRSARINIYEGEKKFVVDNNYLGTFDLIGIKPGSRGESKIAVVFQINVNGILDVTAYESSSGIENNITIDRKNNKLTDNEIQEITQQALLTNDIDTANINKINSLNKLEYLLTNIKNYVHDINEDTMKELYKLINFGFYILSSDEKYDYDIDELYSDIIAFLPNIHNR